MKVVKSDRVAKELVGVYLPSNIWADLFKLNGKYQYMRKSDVIRDIVYSYMKLQVFINKRGKKYE